MSWSSLQTASQIVMVLGAVLAAVAGFGSWYFGKRAQEVKDAAAEGRERDLHEQVETLVTQSENLQAQLEPFRQLAQREFPDLDTEDALQELQGEIEALRAAAEEERATIRSLEAEVRVTFTGEWEQPPFPGQIMSPVTDQYYMEFLASDETEGAPVRFFATGPYDFDSAESGRAVFRSRVAVPSGAAPLGDDAETLADYRAIRIHVPLLLADRLEQMQIVIRGIDIRFFVNGAGVGHLTHSAEHVTPVRYPGESRLQAWASFVVQLDGPVNRWLTEDGA